jgi:hypothetical protein
MRKILLAALLLCLNASGALATKVTLFMDCDRFIKRSNDIIVADCVSAEVGATDGLQAVNVRVVKVLKGDREVGELKIATIYLMKPGARYVLSSGLGGDALGTDFLAIGEMTVVPLPANFDLAELDGKELKEQVQHMWSRHLFDVEQQYERLLAEKKLLEKAVSDRKSVWFKSTGPVILGEIRQGTTQSEGLTVWLDLQGNKLEWSQSTPGKSGCFYYEKMGMPRWKAGWEFSPCPANAIGDLDGKPLKAKFYGLFAPHGEETGLRWSGLQAIQVEVNQVLLARTVEDPHTVYVIQIVAQSLDEEQMVFHYAVIHD